METTTPAVTPLTKYQRRIQNDHRATSRYARRKDIDDWHEQRRLAEQLRGPLT